MTIAILVGVLGAGMAGGAATRKRPRLAAAVAGAAVFMLLLRVLFAYARQVEAALVPWDVYPFFEHFWPVPFGGVILGIAAVHVSRAWLRRAALVVGGLAMAFVGATAWRMGDARPEELTGTVQDGVCYQSSCYSCGAAAAAMFLASRGVEATESEMAILSVTDGFYGTTPVGLLRGLRRKLPGAALTSESWLAPPAASEGPWLVAVSYNALVDHWVVVDRIDAGGADVRDPLRGRVRWSRETLESRWRNVVVR